jgi:hypothetical protein
MARIRVADRGAPAFRRAAERALGLLGAATIISVAPRSGQVEITPFGGVYLSIGDFANMGGASPDGSFSESVRHDVAPAGGVCLIGRVSQKLALAVAVGYSPSGTVTGERHIAPFLFPGDSLTNQLAAKHRVLWSRGALAHWSSSSLQPVAVRPPA